MNNLVSTKEYRVLARKYRPQFFKDLIGQDALVQTLSNSIKNNRVAHAYLLTGVRGIGKTTTARILSKALNCLDIENQYEPCGKCDSCISIHEDRNIDVIEMDAASNTGVDDIREIIENVKYKPTICKYKIFIIDEVHMLSKNAFNALLKTLEEPPPHIKFIFATTEVKKIPVTIISRCQRFDLHRVNAEVLISHLNSIAKNENIKINNDAMALIVRSADGSVRDGLSLLDQAIANESDDISIKTISLMLGLADRGKIFDLLDAIFNADSSLSLDIYNELYESGADILAIFDEMLKVTHFLTQLLISPKIKDDIYIPELERTRGTEMTQKLKLSSLGRFWQVLFKGYQELQYGSHIFQLGEMIIIRLIFIHEGPSPGDLVKKIEKEINKIEKTQAVTSENYEKKSTEVVNIEKNLSNKNKDESLNILPINSFREFVDLFYQKREGILHAHLYNSTKLISFKEGEVVINAEKILDHNFSRTIARNISKWTGRIWNISTSSSNIGKTLQEEDIMMKQKEIELMKKDPEVQKILNKYQGVSIHSITKIGLTSDEKIKDKKQDKKLKR
tara:strand:+ start:1033 stop:2724 length:1692 start_codon:yes stop_codon:yes gene_type:complete